MKKEPKIRPQQAGAALLIAIFALLLISVVGIALLISTSADTALAGNYRTSTGAYYAALAGLEEARGRLLLKNPAFIGNTVPSFFPPLAMNTVLYILNPNTAIGESVNPTDPSNPYADKEYDAEFAPTWPLNSATVYSTNSVSPLPSATPPLPGPGYKWVRVNPVTEHALGVTVAGPPGDDPFVALYYDGTGLNKTSTGAQALEITALAVMPSGSTKLLQYVVSTVTASPSLPSTGNSFPAALTLAGTNVLFTGPGTNSFYIQGQDQCTGSTAITPAIGYANAVGQGTGSSQSNILAGATPPSNYLGAPLQSGPPPGPSLQSFGDVSSSIQPAWLTPAGLDSVVQSVTNNADVVIQGPATPSSFPSNMSASNPMTIVVNGDLNLSAWHNIGFGLLLVTGTLYYDPDATWEGIVLVIGQGNFVSTNGGTGGIDGAVFIAKTRDPSGNLLPALGAASYSQTGSGNPTDSYGRGINYNSCWISKPLSPTQGPIQGPLSYKILSFREITQQ